MKEFYVFSEELSANSVGADSKITLQKTTEVLQRLANENAERSGYGFSGLLNSANAYWVISKIRIVFEKIPHHKDVIVCRTWPIKPEKIILERDFEIKSEEDGLLISATSDWCMIDAHTRRICRIHPDTVMTDIDYLEERANAGEYTKQKYQVDDTDFCYEKTIRSSDIDMNGHTNNTKYSLMASHCFSTQFLNQNDIYTFEIHFLKESFEGEKLFIYRKELANKNYYITALNEKKQVVFRAYINFR